MKRVIKKKDISEPTFVSSTSRVPTVGLPEGTGTRSRSGSRSRSRSGSLLRNGPATVSAPNLHSAQPSPANAPPVPPINPRRRTNMLGSLMGRKSGGDDDHLSMPQLPYAAADAEENRSSAFSVSDEEEEIRQRRRLKKATSEAGRVRSGTVRGAPPLPMHSPAPAVAENAMPGSWI
ncbi:MAG: hypothetical protein IMZ46_08175 [Acidobacteria bacterium]|nr:hypothetical protein [Acidobacteriota bacterium]